MLKNIVIQSLLVFTGAFGLFSTGGPEIVSPSEGQVIQGNVEIVGTIPEDDFESADLSYAYDNEEENATWFEISPISQPVTISLLTKWDTTTISDGDYKLKLTVTHQDGSSSEFISGTLLVRNYTPVEMTMTPTSDEMAAVVTVEPTVTPDYFSATPYPKNDASLSVKSVKNDLVSGSLVGVFCIIGLGIYTALSGWLRGR